MTEEDIIIDTEEQDSEQTPHKETLQSLMFEDIEPWVGNVGDTGLSSRLKLKRNFDRIRLWANAIDSRYLSRLYDDTARGFIRMIKGLQVGERFVTGLLGEGGVFRKETDGTTYIEADKLYIRMRAYFDTVEIRDYKHSAGNRIASPAGARCCRVEYIGEDGEVVNTPDEAVLFRCYFRGSDGEDEVRNNFIVGDQAYCHVTSVETAEDSPEAKGLNTKHYWRLIVGRNPVGTLTDDGEHWIDLSNRTTETLTIGGKSYTHAGYQTDSDVPSSQDDIIQLGNIYDTTRQGAIIEFVSGADAPSYQIYQGINDYSLNGKNYIGLGYSSQNARAYMNVYGDAFIGDPSESTYIKYNAGTRQLEVKAKISAQSTIDGETIEQFIAENTWTEEQIDALITAETDPLVDAIDEIKRQVDGSISTWFYDGVPTLENEPASGWTTDDDKNEHLGDLYYDNLTGYAYRFKYDELNRQWSWGRITDTDVTKALADAAKAQDTADHKRRVFVVQPTPPYDAGDLWVNATYPTGNTETNAVQSKYYNDVLRCNTSKAEGTTFAIADWGLASKYTDDKALNDFKANQYVTALTNGTISTNITNAQTSADNAQRTANGAATAAANAQAAAQAAEAHAATLDYVKAALKQDTVIEGGLVLSTLIALRDRSNHIWSGISGTYQSTETGTGYKGHGIAAWYGGAMVDKEVTTTATDYAKSLFRFDGSGYVAGGNLSWDKNGNVTIQGYSINTTTLQVGGSDVATQAALANYVTIGTAQTITGAKTFGTTNGSYIQIGAIRIVYDQSNNALKIVGSDGTSSANLYATGGVSALGQSSSGSGGIDMAAVWTALGNNTSEQINASHLSTALSSYATQTWVTQQIAASATGGTVTAVKVGTTTYNPVSGVVSLPNYLPLTGGNLSGSVTFANKTWNTVGDDSRIGDINVGGTLGVKGANGQTAIAFVNKDDSYYVRLVSPVVTSNITINLPFSAGTLALTSQIPTTMDWSSITNKPTIPAADEEDITLSGSTLKFKDRPNTSGMGMVILRKNMVGGVNTLTQGMLNQTNTTYVIQYDYYLVSDINIPESCTLRFEGGCIHNSQVSGTYNSYKLIADENSGVHIIEDGHMIFDWVHINGKIKNNYINASSLGVTTSNKTDNAGRLNRFRNLYCGVRLDEYGVYDSNIANGKYYLIESPVYVSNYNGKLVGVGNASNSCSLLVPSESFKTNYPDRAVVESLNYWAGLDGRSASYTYVYGLNIENIQIRCYNRADYGLAVWATGENCNLERILISEAAKANFFLGGYSAAARLRLCASFNTSSDAYAYLFDNHPRTDYAPNVSAENGGRGFGGSASLVECSGDATNWLKTGNGGFALDIVAPKVESVNRVITSDNNSTGNTEQQIRITGGRIQFNSSAGDKTILYAKSETKCVCTIENMTAYNHQYMAYYTDTSSGINNIGSADTINHWSNGNLEARGSNGVRASYFRALSWSDQRFGVLSNGITNTLAATGNQTGWIVQSDYSAALIYRNMLMMQAGVGGVFRIFSMNGGKDAQTIVMDTSKLSGTTANRPKSVTMFGKTYEVARGYCYFDTTLGKPVWYNNSGSWIEMAKESDVETLKSYFANGVAKSAAKFATARTLWGQTFDGTANVSGTITVGGGDIVLNNNKYVYIKNTSGTDMDVLRISTSDNLLIGYGLRTASSGTYIHGGTKGIQLRTNGTTTRMFIDSAGNVGIGTTSPSYALHVSGDIYATGGVTALSDIRKKNVVRDIVLDVDGIANARPILFRWKDGHDNDVHAGAIAQEWQKILPQSVNESRDGELSLQYGVAALISVIATARKVVDHERRIKELEKENERLRFGVEQLKIA